MEEQIRNGSTTPVADALKVCGMKSSTQVRGRTIPNAKYSEMMTKIQRWRREPARTQILNDAAGVDMMCHVVCYMYNVFLLLHVYINCCV